MITNILQWDYFHGSESVQCHSNSLYFGMLRFSLNWICGLASLADTLFDFHVE